MQTVTAVLVAYVLACIAFPQLVKHRQQFFAAVGVVLVIIFLDCVGNLPDSPATSGVHKFIYFVNALLQMTLILLLILSTEGQSLSDLKGEMGKTIDLVRRGGEKETIIVPLRGEQPKPRVRPPATSSEDEIPQDMSIPMD